MQRERVETLLLDAPLVFVSAPAGFGKTTTVRNALSLCRQDGEARVVWVELGSDYLIDAATVTRGLTTSLSQLGVDVGDLDVEPSDPLSLATISRLGAALAAVDGPVTLVLDDFHRVGARLASQLCDVLCRWVDDERRMIVCTRSGPPELAQWAVGHRYVVVGPQDLRLDNAKIAEVLGPGFSEQVETVAAVTGGWPFAVETMRRNLEIDPGNGLERAITELEPFIRAEVLPLLDAEDLFVLTSVCLSERFTPGVADRVSLRPGSAERLRRLELETGLVTCDGSSVSLVPVVRRALVGRLHVMDPDRPAALHARIAEAWLDEPDSLEATVQAIDHLIEGGRYERAVELIRGRWGQMYTASRPDLLVGLIDRVPTRYWADDAGVALLTGWANALSGRSARALDLLQSRPLRTPVGEAIKRLVWANNVWWTTAPAEALGLVAEGRELLAALDVDTTFPSMPQRDTAASFEHVADGAEPWALFLLGDLAGALERLDAMLQRPSEHRSTSVAGLHAQAALVRASCGERDEAIEHLRVSRVIARELGAEDHYLMATAALAAAVLAVWDADDEVVQRSLETAVRRASIVGAANFLRVCELVAHLAGHRFCPPDAAMLERAAKLPLVELQTPIRTARRLVDLGDHERAAKVMRGARPHELALSSWVHVLLTQLSPPEVRDWLAAQPSPTCAHGTVIRLLAEATVAADAGAAVDQVRAAVALASDRRMVAVVADAPAALWQRQEVVRLDLPLLRDAHRLLSDGRRRTDRVRFSSREIELLRLMAQSATAPETAERLYLSVNTVKWHKANIYRKLGVQGAREAVDRARELGLIPADDLVV
jgi:DNA-binding CsgD family transcriptional regulator